MLRRALTLAAAALVAAPAAAGGQSGAARSAAAFDPVAGIPPPRAAGAPRAVRPTRFAAFRVDQPALAAVLDDGPATVALPDPDGGTQRFRVREQPVLAPDVAAANPRLRSYAGTGVDDPAATVALSLTPLGLNASVRSPDGGWYVDPLYRGERSAYVAYDRAAVGADERDPLEEAIETAAPAPRLDPLPRGGEAVTRRLYRIALLSDDAYAQDFGGQTLAAKTALLTRVAQVYRSELAIDLQLVLPAGTPEGRDPLSLATAGLASTATIANGPCGAAPCFASAPTCRTGATLDRATLVMAQLLAGTRFDVGHVVLGRGSGGLASVAVVGAEERGAGCTSLDSPVGDQFAVDYVAHELGHQFGANHTFAGQSGSCASNRNPLPGTDGAGPTTVEPGSGSTIMAYAGICRRDDLQRHTDPWFSWRSALEITATTTAAPDTLREVQTVSLRGFDGTDAFALGTPGRAPVTIRRGTNYSAAGVRTALATLGIAADVTAYGSTATTLGDAGFTVRWTGTGDRDLLTITNGTGATTGFAGETVPGGPATSGGQAAPAGNAAPVVSAQADTTIPVRTPFTLTGAATDPDGDPVTYLWEQANADRAAGTPLLSDAKTAGPLFRVFGQRADVTAEAAATSPAPGANAPAADATRTFPDLQQVLAGNTNAATGTCPDSAATGTAADPVPVDVVECFAEFLPTAAYRGSAGVLDGRLRFRLTARDNRADGGGTGFDDTDVALDTTAGPFRVTAPGEGAAAAAGGPLDVAWDVANTTNATTNAQAVRITLSLDDGLTYPVVLAASTPNDGAETVPLPADAPQTATARVRVEAVGGVFFDVSHAPLAIGPPVPAAPAAPAQAAVAPAAAARPAPARLRPRLVSRGRLALRRGRLALRLRCAAAGAGTVPRTCGGSVQVTARVGGRLRRVGRASFRGRSGRPLTVRVRLSRPARRLAERRGGLRATLQVRTRNPGARAGTARRAVRLTTRAG